MTIDLDELERLGKAAPPGPWHEHGGGIGTETEGFIGATYDGPGHEGFADFVIAARANWQPMIDEIRLLRSELEASNYEPGSKERLDSYRYLQARQKERVDEMEAEIRRLREVEWKYNDLCR